MNRVLDLFTLGGIFDQVLLIECVGGRTIYELEFFFIYRCYVICLPANLVFKCVKYTFIFYLVELEI